MAAERVINFDKTEIVLIVQGLRKYKVLNLAYSDIQRVQIDPLPSSHLFKKVDSEKITIITSRYPEPVVYTKRKHRKYWEAYKTGLAKFAASNHITLVDNVKTQ